MTTAHRGEIWLVDFGEKVEDVKSVSTKRLIRRLGVTPGDRLDRADHALRLLLGL